MKNYILRFAMLLTFLMVATPSGHVYGQLQDDEIERIEIPDKEIPEEARMDIIDKFHGAIIIKAYKEMLDGEHIGYMVEVKKGPDISYIRYDTDGNPLNKMKPQ